MPPLLYERLGLTGVFEQGLTSALHEVITDGKNVELLRRFRAGYDFRQERARSELSEWSLNQPRVSGLKEALQEALAAYIPIAEDGASGHLAGVGREITGEWISDLDKESADVIDDKLAISQFATALVKQGVDPKVATVLELKRHVVQAMEGYYDRREADASVDLW